MFVPPSSGRLASGKLKKIVASDAWYAWGNLPMGRAVFQRDRCPVDTCELSELPADAASADAVLFRESYWQPGAHRPPHQVEEARRRVTESSSLGPPRQAYLNTLEDRRYVFGGRAEWRCALATSTRRHSSSRKRHAPGSGTWR